ncbi:hypothetical protein, partial, partial [Parasitella parasitica]
EEQEPPGVDHDAKKANIAKIMQMHPALLLSVNRGNTPTLKKPKAMATITKKTYYTAIMMLSAEFFGYPYDIYVTPLH